MLIPLLTLGCAGVGASEAARSSPLGLTGRQADWVTRVFGRPPDLVTVFKPYPGMDTDDMRSGGRKAEDSAVGFAYVHCRQADAYVYGDVDRYLTEDNDSYGDGAAVFPGVREIEVFARASGASCITCEVNVRPPNPESLAFHDRQGFVDVGTQETEDGRKTVSLRAKSLLGSAA